jgi:hypothetical protein
MVGKRCDVCVRCNWQRQRRPLATNVGTTSPGPNGTVGTVDVLNGKSTTPSDSNSGAGTADTGNGGLLATNVGDASPGPNGTLGTINVLNGNGATSGIRLWQRGNGGAVAVNIGDGSPGPSGSVGTVNVANGGGSGNGGTRPSPALQPAAQASTIAPPLQWHWCMGC